jgi:hypothetical protein
MALTAATDLMVTAHEARRLPIKAGVTIYQGALIGIEAAPGFARPLVAGDAFAGVADRNYDAPAANGDSYVEVKSGVMLAEIPLAGVAQTDAHVKVYASDDGTFPKTATSNSLVGKILGISRSGYAAARLVTDDVNIASA